MTVELILTKFGNGELYCNLFTLRSWLK